MEKTIAANPEEPHLQRLTRVGAAQIWPFILLLAAAASLLLFQNHKTGWEINTHQGWLSSHGISLAKNLVIDDNWLFMFTQKFIRADGSVAYAAYNPFPVFPFLITGLVILPLEPHLATQVTAAHQFMNLFFIGAMLLCFLFTRIFLHNAWQALTVTLLAFSSHYMLTYNDMIFNDIPALFGCMLVLYMIIKLESGAVWRLAWLWAPIIAISMGWQPYAVLAAWLLLDLLRGLWTRQPLPTLLRRPAVIAFAVALGWGGLVLTLQILNEWRVIGGTLQTVPILQKALWRLGLRPQELYTGNEAILSWPAYVEQQVNRTTLMLVPFAYGPAIHIREIMIGGTLLFVLGIITFRRQLSLFILALMFLSYIVWAVLMKQFVTVHDFQSLFMVSMAIAFFSVLVLYLRPAVAPVIAVVTCALFILTVYRINQVKNELVPVVNPVTAQFQSIYDQLPRGSKLFVCGKRDVMGGGHHGVDFYLAGTFSATSVEHADYLIVEGNPTVDGAVPLTDNPNFNLYQREASATFAADICEDLDRRLE